MRLKYRFAIAAAIASMCVPVVLHAQDGATVVTKPRTIAAFKNGLGFFVREGEATLKDGWAVSEDVPLSALGTFWVGSTKSGAKIERLIAGEEDVQRTVPVASVGEMLKANVGNRVTLMSGGEKFEGTLMAVTSSADRTKPTPRIPGDPPQLYAVSSRYNSVYPNPPVSELAILDTATGRAGLPVSSISWVNVFGDPKTDTTITDRVKRIRFKIAGASGKVPITMGYLQKGITWSPAYLVELVDDKTARITAQGMLANDVEDIDGADVYFVVGYPNFVFSDIVSPLSLTQSVTSFISSLSNPNQPATTYTSSIATQSIASNWAMSMDRVSNTGFGYSSIAETPGAQEEDLFLYHVKDVSLKQGERAYYTLFTADVSYEHLYECEIADRSGVDAYGYRINRSDENMGRPQIPQVWHKLRLVNRSKYPWTTAPAMAMSSGSPLAQDKLDYTPIGGAGKLNLTVATDINVTNDESEVARQNGVQINSNLYTKVTAAGKIIVKNFKSKPVDVEINKDALGEAVSVGQEGKATVMAIGWRRVNPMTKITWQVHLNPGEERVLDYSYITYIQ